MPGGALAPRSRARSRSARARRRPTSCRAGQGTVNVVGAAVFAVLSVPASALHAADDDHDGVLDMRRARSVTRRRCAPRWIAGWSILDGATVARTVRVDLILSPEHGAAGGRADQIVALKHAELDAPPTDLRVRCDLLGARASERELTITATRHPASGTETEVGVLTPEATERVLFAPPERAVASTMLGSAGGAPRGFFVAGAVVALALGLSRKKSQASVEVARR